MPGQRNPLRRLGGFLGDQTRRAVTGTRNAVPGTRNWQWQQTLDALALPGDAYDSHTGRWQVPGTATLRNLFGNMFGPRESSQPGEPLPGWMVPGAAMPGAGTPGLLDPFLPVEGDPNSPNFVGPPEWLAGQAPGFGVSARPRTGPGVRGGHVIAQGQDAQNMVEAMRGQGPQMQENEWLRQMRRSVTK